MKSGVEYLAQHPGWKTKKRKTATATKRYYIMVTSRTTYTKYLIEKVDNLSLDDHEGDYLGFVDGETFAHEYSEAFETKEAAIMSDLGYVEGK